MNIRILPILLILFLLGLAQSTSAVTILMKDGSILIGTIVSEDNKEIQFTNDHFTIAIDRTLILYIDQEDKLDIQLGIDTQDLSDVTKSDEEKDVDKTESKKENLFTLKVKPNYKRWTIGFNVGFLGTNFYNAVGPGINVVFNINEYISIGLDGSFGIYNDFSFGYGLSARFHLPFGILGWKPYLGIGIYDVWGFYDDDPEGSSEYKGRTNQAYLSFPISLLFIEGKHLSYDIGLIQVLLIKNHVNVTIEFARIGFRF